MARALAKQQDKRWADIVGKDKAGVLGHFFRRMRARHGNPKAITATAHKLARIVFHLIKTGKTYDETVFADQEKLHEQRLERNIRNQAKSLGFQLVPIEG